jgi:hypothetical protein
MSHVELGLDTPNVVLGEPLLKFTLSPIVSLGFDRSEVLPPFDPAEGSLVAIHAMSELGVWQWRRSLRPMRTGKRPMRLTPPGCAVPRHHLRRSIRRRTSLKPHSWERELPCRLNTGTVQDSCNHPVWDICSDLGALPTVSGTYVHLEQDAGILLDAGEGTLGQLYRR